MVKDIKETSVEFESTDGRRNIVKVFTLDDRSAVGAKFPGLDLRKTFNLMLFLKALESKLEVKNSKPVLWGDDILITHEQQT